VPDETGAVPNETEADKLRRIIAKAKKVKDHQSVEILTKRLEEMEAAAEPEPEMTVAADAVDTEAVLPPYMHGVDPDDVPEVAPGAVRDPEPAPPPHGATVAAINLAREHGITPAEVTGTGKGGKITRGDVQRAIDSRKPATVDDLEI